MILKKSEKNNQKKKYSAILPSATHLLHCLPNHGIYYKTLLPDADSQDRGWHRQQSGSAVQERSKPSWIDRRKDSWAHPSYPELQKSAVGLFHITVQRFIWQKNPLREINPSLVLQLPRGRERPPKPWHPLRTTQHQQPSPAQMWDLPIKASHLSVQQSEKTFTDADVAEWQLMSKDN